MIFRVSNEIRRDSIRRSPPLASIFNEGNKFQLVLVNCSLSFEYRRSSWLWTQSWGLPPGCAGDASPEAALGERDGGGRGEGGRVGGMSSREDLPTCKALTRSFPSTTSFSSLLPSLPLLLLLPSVIVSWQMFELVTAQLPKVGLFLQLWDYNSQICSSYQVVVVLCTCHYFFF